MASAPSRVTGGVWRRTVPLMHSTHSLPGPGRAVFRLTVLALLLGVGTWVSPAAETSSWVEMFNGRDLEGWKANESPQSHSVRDGAIVCQGPRSHLYYTGPLADTGFRHFEFTAEFQAAPGANSGIYFHTVFQEDGWLNTGIEVQVNNTATGDGGYVEHKKTGSLYGIRNVHRQIAEDHAWSTLQLVVRPPHVLIRINGVTTVDYVEPPHPPAQPPGRRLGRGTFALQAHDPGSRVAYRNLRVRLLPDIPTPAAQRPPDVISDLLSAAHRNNIPVVDLHTHLKGGLTLDEVLRRQFRTGINAGIAINGGLGFPVTNDAGLDRALAEIRHPLVFTALQGEGREWSTLFSKQAIARFDYVFTDAMTFTDDQGRRMRLWMPDEVFVGDPELFMDLLVRRTEGILAAEPVDIWVNPTYLPAVLAADYDRLWTPARMDRVIAAAVAHGVAIEINDRFRIPSTAFVRRAKAAGARFTFGTNNGGRDDLGQLEHALAVMRDAGLEWADFWVPSRTPSRAQRALEASPGR